MTLVESEVEAINNLAGPILRGGDIAALTLEAIIEDNPGKEIFVQDHGTYVRIEAAGGLLLRQKTMEKIVGRPFNMQEVQGNMSSFSGKIETKDHQIRWYFKHI